MGNAMASSKPSYTQILVASSIGIILAAAVHYRLKKIRDQKIVPRTKVTNTGQILRPNVVADALSHRSMGNLGFLGQKKRVGQRALPVSKLRSSMVGLR
ncbi:hypothetical protein RND71_035333 [Anisodus tanguticus]|uniref:Uncharacterized protein n=1 Tax=Anisodus tanguticus TaxID=243964 RepID=A0AAE1UVR7_9SOLA|nr:hypothetical protein RND71_035333 [Anisodus tanguticus]